MQRSASTRHIVRREPGRFCALTTQLSTWRRDARRALRVVSYIQCGRPAPANRPFGSATPRSRESDVTAGPTTPEDLDEGARHDGRLTTEGSRYDAQHQHATGETFSEYARSSVASMRRVGARWRPKGTTISPVPCMSPFHTQDRPVGAYGAKHVLGSATVSRAQLAQTLGLSRRRVRCRPLGTHGYDLKPAMASLGSRRTCSAMSGCVALGSPSTDPRNTWGLPHSRAGDASQPATTGDPRRADPAILHECSCGRPARHSGAVRTRTAPTPCPSGAVCANGLERVRDSAGSRGGTAVTRCLARAGPIAKRIGTRPRMPQWL